MAEQKTAKQPQDHKKKVEHAKETDIVITVDGEELTVRGYRVEVGDETVEIEKDALSWDFAEAASDKDIVRMARLVLGDRYEEFRDGFRNSRGRVDVQEFSEFIGEIVEKLPNS